MMEQIPIDLKRVLAKNSKAKALWDNLTSLARRDFVSWIETAKQEETRKRRVESVPSRLLSGKRRPCCYAMVPMNLYTALRSEVKAKVTWKGLTPIERRNFVQWIESGKDKESRRLRVVKVCSLLRAGKRNPL